MIVVKLTVCTAATQIEIINQANTPYQVFFAPGGMELVMAFLEHLKEQRGLLVSWMVCGRAILQLGHQSDNVKLNLWGRKVGDGSPVSAFVTTEEVKEVIAPVKNEIVAKANTHLREFLSRLNPQGQPVLILLAGEFNSILDADKQLTEALGFQVMIVS